MIRTMQSTASAYAMQLIASSSGMNLHRSYVVLHTAYSSFTRTFLVVSIVKCTRTTWS